MRSSVRLSLSVAAIAATVALVAAAPSTHRAGPPWISIEYPANPLDPTTRGAFLLVHAFHHQMPMESEVSGTAEGLVGAERKSIALRFEKTGRTGVYALRKQWSDDGIWSLVISAGQDGATPAQALIELAADGGISSVRVPTTRQREWTVPRRITSQEVEQSLQSRATRTAEARR